MCLSRWRSQALALALRFSLLHAAVEKLSEDVGIPKTLDKIREEDLDQLAEDALNDACYPGNPREATKEQVKELFRKIMA